MAFYENGKIYKIIHDNSENIYIGSTCSPLYKRMAQHKGSCKLRNDAALYTYMREYGADHFKIILIEDVPCSRREELTRREQHYIDLLQPALNMKNALNETPDANHITAKIKTICSCGAEISNGSMKWHQKSKKHLSTEELKTNRRTLDF